MHTLYRSEEIAQMDARALEQGATLESLTSAVGRQMARCVCQAHPHAWALGVIPRSASLLAQVRMVARWFL